MMIQSFIPLLRVMKRRADKGLLEGVTSADIDAIINELEHSCGSYKK